jgi:hypothetical protein
LRGSLASAYASRCKEEGRPHGVAGRNRPRPRRMSVLYGSVGKERREEERRWNERSWPLWMVSTN